MACYTKAAKATCDHYINDCSASDGLVYWDDGPELWRLGDWRSRPADPYNDHEPVDSSAAAIAAQGLIRLGNYLGAEGSTYSQAGLTIAKALLGAALSLRGLEAPGTAASFGVPSSQRLGLHPAGAEGSVRRIELVGGLSHARIGAAAQANDGKWEVFDVF